MPHFPIVATCHLPNDFGPAMSAFEVLLMRSTSNRNITSSCTHISPRPSVTGLSWPQQPRCIIYRQNMDLTLMVVYLTVKTPLLHRKSTTGRRQLSCLLTVAIEPLGPLRKHTPVRLRLLLSLYSLATRRSGNTQSHSSTKG